MELVHQMDVGANQDSLPVVVAEEPSVAEPSNEVEVIIRTEVICLDSDDDMPERCVELDVRVKVRDRVPCRVRGTFADYITNDSEVEDYGTHGYNVIKLNLVMTHTRCLLGGLTWARNRMGRTRCILPHLWTNIWWRFPRTCD